MDYSNGTQKRSGGRRDEYSGGAGGASQAKRSRIENASDSYDAVIRQTDDSQTPMLTFKRFLAQQEDDISDEDAIKKYNDYKMEYKRKQLVKFFDSHKDEEWFRSKYHPEESERCKEEKLRATKRRYEIFEELRAKGLLTNASCDLYSAKQLIRIMDTVVVKLEGGSDADVKALESEKIEDDSLAELKDKEEKKTEAEEEKTQVTTQDGNHKDVDASSKEDGAEKMETEEEGDKKENGHDKNNAAEEGAISDGEEPGKKKMQLHKTSSVFLRNVPPSVTQQELEDLCKRSPGFLRICFSEPFPDRRWHRRAWATYKRDVNIKEICWTLNNILIRETNLNGIINKDITRRVRTTNGITAHSTVAQNDLRQAAKLVALLDKQVGMFTSESEEERMKDIQLGVDLIMSSANPVLRSVRNVLMDVAMEEVDAEEEEMLGIQKSQSSHSGGMQASEEADEKVLFNRDDVILKALDSLIFYLRIVHSVDFYFHGEYPNEDKMPNRCGMFHVRATTPTATSAQFTTTDDGKLLVPKKFINDFISSFNQRLTTEFFSLEFVPQDDLVKFGKKDPQEAMEKFIMENTVELAKDKWLCPLSGKKFKGPEFIRKHLESKHIERLDECKVEALFYNNYLVDARRPMDPEAKPASLTASGKEREDEGRRERLDRGGDRERDRSDDRRRDTGGGSFYGSGDRGGGGRNTTYGGNRGSGYDGGRDRGDYGRPPPSQGGGRYFEESRGRRDPRAPIAYRDLDAPDDIV